MYRHLVSTAVCLETANPLINASWILWHRGDRPPPSFWVHTFFGCVVLTVFATTRFGWFAFLLVHSPPHHPMICVGMLPFMVLSVFWFVRLYRFYRYRYGIIEGSSCKK